MKIFVLGTRGFPNVQGGVEKHCEELYPRLVELGCDITVFTRTPYISKTKHYSQWKGVKFIHLWCPQKKNLEAIVHTFLGALVCAVKRPQLVHIHNIGPGLCIPFLKLLGIKTLLTYHSANYQHQKWSGFAKSVLRMGELWGIKFADKVIVISQTAKKFLENTYGRKDLKPIFNGVNISPKLSSQEILNKYNLVPHSYVFTVCRFMPEKGLRDLISGYRNIKNPEFKLVIAGDTDYETEYSKNLKKMAKHTAGVILTGFIIGKPLQELYSNAGLFVLPSYYEGLPIVLLEAFSYGLPVLISDIPANRELPLPELRYFPVGNINQLASKMVKLWKKGISEEEKNNQREILKQNYDWGKIATQTYNVYKEVVSLTNA